jgi:hypothetical protein
MHIYRLISEISTFMMYAVVNASRSPQKATDWSGIKKREFTRGNLTFLVSFDRLKAHLGPCLILWWVVYPVREKIEI